VQQRHIVEKLSYTERVMAVLDQLWQQLQTAHLAACINFGLLVNDAKKTSSITDAIRNRHGEPNSQKRGLQCLPCIVADWLTRLVKNSFSSAT